MHCRELESLRARVNQVSTPDFLQSLMEQIEQTRGEIERIKRAKREVAGSTRQFGKALGVFEETMPESLQKSTVIESDLLILGLKNKGLKKRTLDLEVTMESLARKEEKVEREFENVTREARDLGVNLGEKARKVKFEEAKGRFERFKACLEGIKAKNQRMIRKSEADNREIRGKIAEKEMKIKEEINKMTGVQEKLKALMRDGNVDRNLKEVLDLFAGGRVEGELNGESNKKEDKQQDLEAQEKKETIIGGFEEKKEEKIMENVNLTEKIEENVNLTEKIEEKVAGNEFFDDDDLLEDNEPMENSNKVTEKFEIEKELIEPLETEKKTEPELEIIPNHHETPPEKELFEPSEKTPKIQPKSSESMKNSDNTHIDQHHTVSEPNKNSDEIEEIPEFNNDNINKKDEVFKESSSNLHSKPLKKLDYIGI